ncbi:MAG: zinc metallopeptidase [Synergistaceae bacterium]|jgi:Zn-dependent membrane protease YugP|nr:zinc metallopeptidase [Synergistaceae bacterium]
MFPFFFDPTMLLLIPAVLFAGWAQMKVSSTFNRFSQVTTRRGLTAGQVARELLNGFGLSSVRIEHVSGSLTDHYDPRTRVLALSDSVYGSASIAAIGVAAHEVGHAVQHGVGYEPLALRNGIAPVAGVVSNVALPLFFIGFLFQGAFLMNLGIFLFLGVLAFQLITLPVEYNASSRAIAMLERTGDLSADELGGAKQVLSAAALTYVGATLMAALQLVRLLLLRNSRSRN